MSEPVTKLLLPALDKPPAAELFFDGVDVVCTSAPDAAGGDGEDKWAAVGGVAVSSAESQIQDEPSSCVVVVSIETNQGQHCLDKMVPPPEGN